MEINKDYWTKQGRGKIYCKCCDEWIQNNVKSKNVHENSAKHKSKYEASLKSALDAKKQAEQKQRAELAIVRQIYKDAAVPLNQPSSMKAPLEKVVKFVSPPIPKPQPQPQSQSQSQSQSQQELVSMSYEEAKEKLRKEQASMSISFEGLGKIGRAHV